MAHTTLCARCGKNEVPAPTSVDCDPVCKNCQLEMYPTPYEFNNDEGGCPGWGESCGNLIEDPTGDLCPDCTMGRLNAQSPRLQR